MTKKAESHKITINMPHDAGTHEVPIAINGIVRNLKVGQEYELNEEELEVLRASNYAYTESGVSEDAPAAGSGPGGTDPVEHIDEEHPVPTGTSEPITDAAIDPTPEQLATKPLGAGEPGQPVPAEAPKPAAAPKQKTK